jgi:AraC-like DNA-binding protein
MAPYAQQIGCSERSLTRATAAVTGLAAKEYLTGRVVLEARRLLAHTPEPVTAIASALGFDESNNFVKYFRRETGTTRGAFRSRLADADR